MSSIVPLPNYYIVTGMDKDVDTSFEPDWGTMVGLVLVILVGSLATTAGVGGGAIFIPLFQALVGFPLKESTALSQALITAGSLVSVAMNLFSPSPTDPYAPLIDFPLVLLLTPMLLVGVGIGVLLNYILPSYIISVLLVLLMVLLITQSLGKGIRMWQGETAKKKKAAALTSTSRQRHILVALPDDAHSLDHLEGVADVPSSQHMGPPGTAVRSISGEVRPLQLDEMERQPSRGRVAVQMGAAEHSAAGAMATPPQGDVYVAWNSCEGVPTETDLTGPLLQRGQHQESAAVDSLSQPLPGRPSLPGTLSRRQSMELRSTIGSSGVQQLLLGGGRVDFLSFVPPPLEGRRAGTGSAAAPAPAWLNRRNAWMAGFLRNCSEHVEVQSEAVRHGLTSVMMPPLHEGEEGDEVGSSTLWGEAGEDPMRAAAPQARAGLRRTLSMPSQHEESLLSPHDVALAVAPRRVHQPDAARWQRTAGRTDDELLRLMYGDGDGSGRGPNGVTPRQHTADDISVRSGRPGMECGGGDSAGTGTAAAAAQTPRPAWKAMLAYLSSGWDRVPQRLVALLLTCWVVYVALQQARSLSGRCSPTYWGTFASQLFVMPCFSIGVAMWLAREGRKHRADERQERLDRLRHNQEQRLELVVHVPATELQMQEDATKAAACKEESAKEEQTTEEEEPPANPLRFAFFQAFAFLAGLIGGLLGLGGGMIIGPMLLELGIHPQIGAATSGTMVLFSSSTALIALASTGRLNLQYAAVFSLASMLAAVLGALVIGGIIRRTGRVSIVVLALSAIMVIGGLAVGGFGIVIITAAVKDGKLGPTPLCG